MKKKMVLVLAVMLLFWAQGLGQGFAADKLRLGTGVKLIFRMDIVPLAAEEHGIWKRHGLDVDWRAFRGTTTMIKGMLAGSIDLGVGQAATYLQALHRGVPLIAISDYYFAPDFAFYVRNTSRLRRPQDLKGTSISVTRLGGGTHAFGRIVARKLGLEGQVQFISGGGGQAKVALVQAGKADVVVTSPDRMVELVIKGQFRVLLKVADYLPKPWASTIVFAQRDFVKSKPDVAQRGVRAILEANKFVLNNPDWAIAKWREVSRQSEEAARILYKDIQRYLSRDGKLSPKGFENVNRFLLDYKVVRKPRQLAIEKLYTDQFTK